MLSQQLAPTLPSLQVVCPHAPMGTLTVSGQRMPLWFDIKAPKTREHPELQDRDGMERTRAMLESVIKEEHEQGRKVVLGGFSQGSSSRAPEMPMRQARQADVLPLDCSPFQEPS